MEAEAAATVAVRASQEDLDSIRAADEGIVATTDRFTFGKHDLAFHHAIATPCGNRYFLWFLGLANKHLSRAQNNRF
jgi:DNA-binding FadR family transcriptional regulator